MTPARRTLPFAAALAFVCFGAQAQSQAAGLWEHTFSLSSKGGAVEQAMAMAQQQLASMAPEQRRQLEQMMAKNGIALGANSTAVKACVTPEQAARPAEPPLPAGCTQEVLQRRSNGMKVKFQCTQPRPSSGTADVTFNNDKSYTGSSVLTTEVNGTPQRMNVTLAGKWLAAECGDIKPMPSR